MAELKNIWQQIRLVLKSHPWHGIFIGEDFPEVVNTYIEIVPTDTVKYEIDKTSGYLKVDRPQKYSNVSPTLYGFIPQTLCGTEVANFCMLKTGRENIKGDGDPMDICVLTEKSINHGDVLLKSVPIGGLRMIDGNESDDKIIAVMENDGLFGQWRDISDAPNSLTERLRHYFLTYKDAPGSSPRQVEITHVFGKEEAHELIRRSYKDYLEEYSGLDKLLKGE